MFGQRFNFIAQYYLKCLLNITSYKNFISLKIKENISEQWDIVYFNLMVLDLLNIMPSFK